MKNHRHIRTINTLMRAALLGAMLLLAIPLTVVAQPASAVDQLIEQGTQAGVDPALMRQVAQRAEAAGLNETQTAQLIRPAVELAQQDLPAQGVLQKSLEGLAKRVPTPRIQPVLQRVQTHTQQAGTLVDTWMEQSAAREMMEAGEAGTDRRAARQQLVQSAAQARMHNVPPDVMQKLLETLPAQTQRRPIPPSEVAAALQVMPELMNDGAAPETTIDLLTNALNAGYGASNLRQLPTAMRVSQRHNQHPVDVLARNAARAIAHGTPAADVLSSLFDGGVPAGPPGNVGGGPPQNIPPGQGKPPNGPPGQGDNPPGKGSGKGPPGQGGNSG